MEKIFIKIHSNYEEKNGCFVVNNKNELLTPIFGNSYDLFMSKEYQSLEVKHTSLYAKVIKK